MAQRWCDECQRTIEECNRANDCNEKHAREYFRAMEAWASSSDWIEGGQVY